MYDIQETVCSNSEDVDFPEVKLNTPQLYKRTFTNCQTGN